MDPSSGYERSAPSSRRSQYEARPRRACKAPLLGALALLEVAAPAGWRYVQSVGTKGPGRLGRRQVAVLIGGCAVAPATSSCHGEDGNAWNITTELRYCGGGFCLPLRIDGALYRGLLDTGSPYALVSTCRGSQERCASYCDTWGCASSTQGRESGFKDSYENFAAGRAEVTWRRGQVSLGNRTLTNGRDLTYGVVRRVQSLGGFGGRRGGVFFGLLLGAPDEEGAGGIVYEQEGGPQRTPKMRGPPSFLGQAGYRTISVDLRSPGKESFGLAQGGVSLALDAVPLVDIRRFGAPVRYYAAEVASMKIGTEEVGNLGRIIAVLDTGSTGLVLPDSLYTIYQATKVIQCRRGSSLRAASKVEISFATERGQRVTLDMRQGLIPEYGERFDVVSPIPQNEGISDDANALWGGDDAGDPIGLEIRGRVARLDGAIPATVSTKRPLSRGNSFRLRIKSCIEGPGKPCEVAIGIAPDHAAHADGVLGEAKGTCAYLSQAGRALVVGEDTGLEGPKIVPGDVVECGLTANGMVFWKVNNEMLGPVPFDGALDGGLQYPSIALSGAEIELLSDANGDFEPRAAPGDRPLVCFIGIGFMLGRRLRIDTIAGRAVFD